MGLFFEPILRIVDYLLTLYWWIVVAAAVMSWLVAMRVVNTYSRPVAMIGDFLYRATEPVLRPIRRILPNFGGLDVSPIILLLIIWLIQMELRNLIYYVYRM